MTILELIAIIGYTITVFEFGSLIGRKNKN